MELTIDDYEFSLPEVLQNKHIEAIGIGNLMWVQRLLSKNTKPEEDMNDEEYKAYTERMDQIIPIFYKILKELGISDLSELPVVTTFKLMSNPEFTEWLSKAIGGVF